MTFVQIIEFSTTREADVDALLDQWLERTQGKRTATRGVQTRDRDRANTYVQIVEFPSYEDAVANSELSETSEVAAARLAELCDGPPTFRNLDVTRDMTM
jgi:hypothetical protein